jgi:nodulation protein E
MNTPPRRVVVTGIGAVSALGMDTAALWELILEGRCGIRALHGIETNRLTTKLAAQIVDYREADHFDPRDAVFYDRVTQLTVVAGREAMGMAGLARDDMAALRFRAGVTHAASPGQVTVEECYRTFYAEGGNRLHPFSTPRIMGAAPAAALTLEFGIHGPAFGTASACSSSNHAIGLAFDMIRHGRLDVCLTGGADASLVTVYFKAWEALRVLTGDTSRPFSRDRSGIVLGEAATVLVLEARDHAQARGATILAEILGWGTTSDAGNMLAPDAEYAAAAMRLAVEDAGLTRADIGYVNAHGTATRLNDKTESAAMADVFAGAMPPVSSLKSQTGHTLNASGGMETIATVLALRHQVMPATINYREADPECPVDCIPNTPRPAHFGYALNNSFGFGGLNAVLALGRA